MFFLKTIGLFFLTIFHVYSLETNNKLSCTQSVLLHRFIEDSRWSDDNIKSYISYSNSLKSEMEESFSLSDTDIVDLIKLGYCCGILNEHELLVYLFDVDTEIKKTIGDYLLKNTANKFDMLSTVFGIPPIIVDDYYYFDLPGKIHKTKIFHEHKIWLEKIFTENFPSYFIKYQETLYLIDKYGIAVDVNGLRLLEGNSLDSVVNKMRLYYGKNKSDGNLIKMSLKEIFDVYSFGKTLSPRFFSLSSFVQNTKIPKQLKEAIIVNIYSDLYKIYLIRNNMKIDRILKNSLCNELIGKINNENTDVLQSTIKILKIIEKSNDIQMIPAFLQKNDSIRKKMLLILEKGE